MLTILNTHHHSDHVGSNLKLKQYALRAPSSLT
ncbi:MAG: MBL fold metallo-hydrolase [Methylobacter sp.]|nr:MAG: MBL fold metallo-hydrolase [Methylobacter sp.]